MDWRFSIKAGIALDGLLRVGPCQSLAWSWLCLVCPGSGSGKPLVFDPDGLHYSRLAPVQPDGTGLTLAVAIGREGEP